MRVAEVIARVWGGYSDAEWCAADERDITEDVRSAELVLAAIRDAGWTLVRQAVTIRYCSLHEAEAADSEDPRVCWLYDGGDDCEFGLYRLVPVEGENP